jgi:hypothetical protein
MLNSPELIPAFHGAAGILDELLLFAAPLVVVFIILAIASRRARRNATARGNATHQRPPRDPAPHPPDRPEG